MRAHPTTSPSALLLALLVFGLTTAATTALSGEATAQDNANRKTLRLKPKKRLKKKKKTLDTSKLLGKGRCHKQVFAVPARAENYKAQCTGGEHRGKTFMCSGSRSFTSGGKTYYRQQYCTSSQLPTRYRLSAPTGRNHKVLGKDGADYACGCAYTGTSRSCSGGECSASTM